MKTYIAGLALFALIGMALCDNHDEKPMKMMCYACYGGMRDMVGLNSCYQSPMRMMMVGKHDQCNACATTIMSNMNWETMEKNETIARYCIKDGDTPCMEGNWELTEGNRVQTKCCHNNMCNDGTFWFTSSSGKVAAHVLSVLTTVIFAAIFVV